MIWQFNPYALPLLIGLLPVMSFIWETWHYRNNLAARFFILFTLGVIGFMLTYALELLSPVLPQMLFWLKLEYIFSLTIPVVWLFFILAYCGHLNWIQPRIIAVLAVIPAIHLLTVWTNEFHGLNWQTVSTQTINNFALFERTYGPMFWIGTIYLYGVVLVATIIMIVFVLRSPGLYRGQIVSLILATTLIWAGHVFTVTGLTIVPHLDLTPFGFALACAPIAWSLFHYRLFEIAPAARDAIVRSMSDAIIVMDEHNRVIDLNPAAEKLIQQKASTVIGQPAHIIFASAIDLVERYQNVHEIQDELTVGEGEARRYLDLQISPLRDRKGNLTARIIVLRDITRLKKAEETIRHYADELEARNSELDAYNHSIAHDLKTPLTSVVGFAEFIMQVDGKNLSPQTREYMEYIQRSSSKMTQMVNDMLTLAKIRDINDSLTTIAVNPVVEAAVERFRQDIAARAIRVEIMPDMPRVLGHSLWLEEVFANLLSNAIKYIGKDNPDPFIAIRGIRHETHVRFEVQDNGLGIDQHDRARLFRLFTRFHEDEASGLGLGLSIFLRIVKRLGGDVGLESEPGKGSTFWFTIPARPEMNAQVQTSASPSPVVV